MRGDRDSVDAPCDGSRGFSSAGTAATGGSSRHGAGCSGKPFARHTARRHCCLACRKSSGAAAVAAYRAEEGDYPATPGDLATEGYLAEAPSNPDYTFSIDANGVVTVTLNTTGFTCD